MEEEYEEIHESMFAGAAMAGLMTGAVARTYAAEPADQDPPNGKTLSTGASWPHRRQGQSTTGKGKNSCKGQGAAKPATTAAR